MLVLHIAAATLMLYIDNNRLAYTTLAIASNLKLKKKNVQYLTGNFWNIN